MFKFIVIIFITVNCWINGCGQETFDFQPYVLSEKAGCDTTEAELHNTLTKFKENSLKESFLIIIGRPSKAERQSYNSKRISTVVDYFIKQGVNKQKIAQAKAQPIDEFGYVEIFVNGQLLLIMRSNPQKNFCTYCCEAPDVKNLPKKFLN